MYANSTMLIHKECDWPVVLPKFQRPGPQPSDCRLVAAALDRKQLKDCHSIHHRPFFWGTPLSLFLFK